MSCQLVLWTPGTAEAPMVCAAPGNASWKPGRGWAVQRTSRLEKPRGSEQGVKIKRKELAIPTNFEVTDEKMPMPIMYS